MVCCRAKSDVQLKVVCNFTDLHNGMHLFHLFGRHHASLCCVIFCFELFTLRKHGGERLGSSTCERSLVPLASPFVGIADPPKGGPRWVPLILGIVLLFRRNPSDIAGDDQGDLVVRVSFVPTAHAVTLESWGYKGNSMAQT